MTFTNFITTVFATSFLTLCLSLFNNPVHADARSDAQNRCVQQLGQGAVAEEELDFGAVSYVCNCAEAYSWNNHRTKCEKRTLHSLRPVEKTIPSETIDVPAKKTVKETPQSIHELGRLAENRNDHAQAAIHYRNAADLGNAHSMFRLGYAYEYGKGVELDLAKALRWFRLADENGDVEASFSIGYMLAWGKGTRPNIRKAVQMVEKSIEAGSQHSLQQMTSNSRFWPPKFRREFQKSMRENGIYSGVIDGAFGPGTKKALKRLAGKL